MVRLAVRFETNIKMYECDGKSFHIFVFHLIFITISLGSALCNATYAETANGKFEQHPKNQISSYEKAMTM